MPTVDEQSKRRLTEDLTKLVTLASHLQDKQILHEARTALGDLGDAAGRLLAGRDVEDIAMGAALSELDVSIEALRRSPDSGEAKRRFDLSLGDVEYRVRRLFGVSVR